jgi:hypothetical protein
MQSRPVYYNDIIRGKFLKVADEGHVAAAETAAYRTFAQSRKISKMVSHKYDGKNVLVDSHVDTRWKCSISREDLVLLPRRNSGTSGPQVTFADKPKDMTIECNLSIISLFICYSPGSGSMLQPSVNSRKVDPSKMTDPASGLGKSIFEEFSAGFDAGGNLVNFVPYELELVVPNAVVSDEQNFFGIAKNYGPIVKSVSQLRGWSEEQYTSYFGGGEVEQQDTHHVYNESYLSGVKAITPTFDCCQRTLALFGYYRNRDGFENEHFGDLLMELRSFVLVTNEDVQKVVHKFKFGVCLDMALPVSVNRLVLARYIQVRTKASVPFTSFQKSHVTH